MPGIYLDTSALGRIVLGEADAPAIRAMLAQFDPWRASELLVVESRRLGRREGVSAAVEEMLALVTLTAVPRSLLEQASLIDPIEVRSLDSRVNLIERQRDPQRKRSGLHRARTEQRGPRTLS